MLSCVALSPGLRLCRPLRAVAPHREASIKETSSLELMAPLLLASAVVVGYHWAHPPDVLAATATHREVPTEFYRLAENEDFWANMARYSRFFVSVMVGTVYTILKPFGELLKNPISAVAVIGGGVVLYVFIRGTLTAMLGLDDV